MQLGAKQQQSKAIYPLSPLPQVVFFPHVYHLPEKELPKALHHDPRGGPSKGHACTHVHPTFKKKMELVGKIHGQIRIQSVYVRLLELDSAQQEGKGMGAHTCRMLVGGEAPEEELAKGSSPLGKEGRESA